MCVVEVQVSKGCGGAKSPEQSWQRPFPWSVATTLRLPPLCSPVYSKLHASVLIHANTSSSSPVLCRPRLPLDHPLRVCVCIAMGCTRRALHLPRGVQHVQHTSHVLWPQMRPLHVTDMTSPRVLWCLAAWCMPFDAHLSISLVFSFFTHYS